MVWYGMVFGFDPNFVHFTKRDEAPVFVNLTYANRLMGGYTSEIALLFKKRMVSREQQSSGPV